MPAYRNRSSRWTRPILPTRLPLTALTLVGLVAGCQLSGTAGTGGDPATTTTPGRVEAVVTRVVDGDTIRVEVEDRSEVVRLIGINAPESGECFSGEAAAVLAALTPPGSQVALTVDVSERDRFHRLLRYLWVGGMPVNEELVRRGAALARRYPPDTARARLLEVAQSKASAARLGLWAAEACGPSSEARLRIVDVEHDPPGDDNLKLNDETVVIENQGDNVADLTGWWVKDESASHRYRFPTGFGLGPGERVTIHTGCGEDFDTSLYWCSVGSAIWNNDGDTVFLVDPRGNTHHSLGY